MKILLREKLLEIPYTKLSSPTQIITRCIFCGDSQKNPHHGHLYIKLNLNNVEPILFHCFKCEIGGILTPSILRSFKINDLQLNSSLISYNKKSIRNNKHLGVYNNDLNLKVPTPKYNKKTLLKKEYIEKRLGIKIPIEELVDLKMIFNLGDFLEYNEIEKITVSKQKALLIHNDYIGFLTAKNEFINFRDITESHDRYIKYNIYNNLDNTRKFYTIPNNIDLLTPNKITINIAEGVFDILGIYYHLYEKECNNIIYVGVCGSGFISVIKYFIKMGIFGNIDINIYSDRDHNPLFYKKLKEELKDWVSTINLFYNEKEKDYGFPKDRLEIIRRKIPI